MGYYNYSLFLYNQNRFEDSLNSINKALNIPSAPEGKNIKTKILERLNQTKMNLPILIKVFSYRKRLGKIFYYLSKVNDSEKDSKFIAALTYLPKNINQDLEIQTI